MASPTDGHQYAAFPFIVEKLLLVPLVTSFHPRTDKALELSFHDAAPRPIPLFIVVTLVLSYSDSYLYPYYQADINLFA